MDQSHLRKVETLCTMYLTPRRETLVYFVSHNLIISINRLSTITTFLYRRIVYMLPKIFTFLKYSVILKYSSVVLSGSSFWTDYSCMKNHFQDAVLCSSQNHQLCEVSTKKKLLNIICAIYSFLLSVL